jgi:chemotaxis signal transduction protein/truncated hemoglobin YjbI
MSELALVEDRAVSDRNEEQLVTMTVEGQLFGLPILSVQDIVETHKITQVPRTPSAISGIMNLRGRIVTVINLRRILGRSDDSNSRMGVTVEFKGDLYTILVDQIGEVRMLNRKDFEAAPTTLDSKLRHLCTGIYRLDGELLAVLDVNQILDLETIAQTPPIQFIARRPKEVTETGKASQKSLPAPANEDSEVETAKQETETTKEATPQKQGKNLFRKQKSSAAGKKAASPKESGENGETAKNESAPKPSKTLAPVKKVEASAKAAASPVGGSDHGAAEHATPAAKSGAHVSPCAPKQIAQTENLLELIGGDGAFTAVVTGFYQKVAADKKLAAHFGGADMQRQGKAMQSFLAEALKGNAGGKSVAARDHKWLSPKKGLNDDDFNSCLSHFEDALRARKVPDGTIFRVLALFERYRESVVD